MRAKIINIFGGPNVGKTTYAAHLYVQMKIRGKSVALVQEAATDYILEDRMKVVETDQLSVFTEQNRRLLCRVDSFDYIISDSPILLSHVYFKPDLSIYNKRDFETFILSTFRQYNNNNVYLDRTIDWGHDMTGRRFNKEQSIAFDSEIKDFLEVNNIPFRSLENNIAKVEIDDYIIR